VEFLRTEEFVALNFDGLGAEVKARVLTTLFELSYVEFESLRVLLEDWSDTYENAVGAVKRLVN